MLKPNDALYVKKVRGMGRGVFTSRPIRKGEIIEVCPVIPLPRSVSTGPVSVGIDSYLFKWGTKDEELAIALGFGSIYNHSTSPNATFTTRYSQAEIVFRASRDIAADEQIFIDYEWSESDYASFR